MEYSMPSYKQNLTTTIFLIMVFSFCVEEGKKLKLKTEKSVDMLCQFLWHLCGLQLHTYTCKQSHTHTLTLAYIQTIYNNSIVVLIKANCREILYCSIFLPFFVFFVITWCLYLKYLYTHIHIYKTPMHLYNTLLPLPTLTQPPSSLLLPLLLHYYKMHMQQPAMR